MTSAIHLGPQIAPSGSWESDRGTWVQLVSLISSYPPKCRDPYENLDSLGHPLWTRAVLPPPWTQAKEKEENAGITGIIADDFTCCIS